jgi:hypothetical protein
MGLDQITNLYTSIIDPLVSVIYNVLTQSLFRLESVKSSSCEWKISLRIFMPAALAALHLSVLVVSHHKVLIFVRLYAWSMLSFGSNPPPAQYPAFTVYLATTLSKKWFQR